VLFWRPVRETRKRSAFYVTREVRSSGECGESPTHR
jgi:hypothetical protein